jgi:hypothetical protein
MDNNDSCKVFSLDVEALDKESAIEAALDIFPAAAVINIINKNKMTSKEELIINLAEYLMESIHDPEINDYVYDSLVNYFNLMDEESLKGELMIINPEVSTEFLH